MKAKTVGLIGYACDDGGTVRGSVEGPKVLRSRNLKQSIEALRIQVVDYGDAVADSASVNLHDFERLRSNEEKTILRLPEVYTACRSLRDKVTRACDEGAFPVIIGGDHSSSIGSVTGISNFYRSKGKSIGLIWVDTHPDINVPGTSPSKCAYGMSVAVLGGLLSGALSSLQQHGPAVDLRNVVYIGLRDVDPGEKGIIKSAPLSPFTMTDIDIRGMYAVAQEAIEIARADTAGFIVSFDLDVCDPRVAPATGTPVRGGLSYREAHLLLEMLAASNSMLGFEMVELNPRLDTDYLTADFGISVVESALGKTIL